MQRAGSKHSLGHPIRIAAAALAFLTTAGAVASAATLDRIRQTGKIELGYRTDARPFSYKDDSGKATGYSVALCGQVADQVKASLNLSTLAIEWVPVSAEEQFHAVQDNKIDLLCGAAAETLTRRKDVSFSLPIFAGGIGALLRADAPVGLQQVLSGRPPSGPLWRGSPAQLLEKQVFSVVAGTTSETWLAGRLDKLQLTATVVPVKSYDEGIQRVLERESNVLFGARAILLDAANRSPSTRDFMLLQRQFTYEPFALALERNDDDFRLIVDRTLVHLYASDQFQSLYVKWFGETDEGTASFFKMNTLPE
jgi:ABC-type amino acid transport substrate-binding protein